MNSVTFVVGVVVALGIAGCEQPPGEGVEKVTSGLSFGGCANIPNTDVCVCTGANGTGACADLNGIDRFFMNLSTAPGLTQFNDTITSISVGSLARGKICADPGGNGNCGYLPNNATFLDLGAGLGCPGHSCTSGIDFGWGCKCMNNNITSIRIDQNTNDCSAPGPEQAAFFEDPNFNGGMQVPSGSSHDCVVLDLGSTTQYPNPFANAVDVFRGGGFGLNTDVISSVKLGNGTLVQLFADPNFSGAMQMISTSTPTLTTLNDKTSSITVF
jgi:hypothetical protein